MTDTATADLDIFEGLPTAPTTQPTTTEPAAKAPETSTDETPSEWPKSVSEKPEGAVTVSDFAAEVNKKIVRDKMGELLALGTDPIEAALQAKDNEVPASTFYQAVKALRNPLPHYIVRTTEDVPVKDSEGNDTGNTETKVTEKTFVPLDVALEWWDNKPARGAGASGNRTDEQVDSLVLRAGKLYQKLHAPKTGLIARLARTQEQHDKAVKLHASYTDRLTAEGKSWDDAHTAYDAWAATQEADKTIEDDSK